MNSEEAWKMQTQYAKSRLVQQLALQTTSLIPEVLLNLLNSSLKNYTWSDEEAAQIGKIVIVLDGIREHRQQLETLCQPLIATYWRPSSSAPTSEPSQTTTEDGDALTNKQESLARPDASLLAKPPGEPD
jgi:hypothetical protein